MALVLAFASVLVMDVQHPKDMVIYGDSSHFPGHWPLLRFMMLLTFRGKIVKLEIWMFVRMRFILSWVCWYNEWHNIPNRIISLHVHTGAARPRTEVWFWIDGTPLAYQNWQVGEPNNGQGDENRAVMNMNPGIAWHITFVPQNQNNLGNPEGSVFKVSC